MATKTKKTITAKSGMKVKDLSTRKDPKGGGQKKETQVSGNRGNPTTDKGSGRVLT